MKKNIKNKKRMFFIHSFTTFLPKIKPHNNAIKDVNTLTKSKVKSLICSKDIAILESIKLHKIIYVFLLVLAINLCIVLAHITITNNIININTIKLSILELDICFIISKSKIN